MAEYVLLDVGIGGLVIVMGGAALIVFAVLAFIIIRLSIRAIKRGLEKEAEEEAAKTENTDEEI